MGVFEDVLKLLCTRAVYWALLPARVPKTLDESVTGMDGTPARLVDT